MQARVLGVRAWAARGGGLPSQKSEMTAVRTVLCTLSRVWLCDPVDRSPPASSVQGFLRQECWRGLPFSPPGGLPHPGIEPATLASPASPELAGRFFTS